MKTNIRRLGKTTRIDQLCKDIGLRDVVVKQQHSRINKLEKSLKSAKKWLFGFQLLSLAQGITLLILSYLLSGCGGVVEGQDPTHEPRDTPTTCELVKSAPQLSCCFGSTCELDCSPHEGRIACFIEYQCLAFEEKELNCYELETEEP